MLSSTNLCEILKHSTWSQVLLLYVYLKSIRRLVSTLMQLCSYMKPDWLYRSSLCATFGAGKADVSDRVALEAVVAEHVVAAD